MLSLALLASWLAAPALADPWTVTVYVWDQDFFHQRAGHVAIRLRDNDGETYLSFWPKDSATRMQELFGAPGVWHETLADDVAHEYQKQPSAVLDMSNLDEPAMKRYILAAKRETKDWGVLRGESCVTYASKALKIGGLDLTACAGRLQPCAARLEPSYARFLNTALAKQLQLARHEASFKLMTANVPPQTANVPPQTANLPLQTAKIPRPIQANPPLLHAHLPTPSANFGPGCPAGYHRDDGACYPNDLYQPGKGESGTSANGADVPGTTREPKDFGPGTSLRSR